MTIDERRANGKLPPATVPGPYRHIVATVVVSSLYEIVAQGSAMLAAATAAELHLVHVGRGSRPVERSTREQLARRLEVLVPGTALEVLEGDAAHPAAVLDRYVGALDRGVASVACHGYRGLDLILGSVTEDLLDRGRAVVTFGPAAEPERPRRVAVCLDGSPWAERLMPEAVRWAGALDVPLWLVQAVGPEGSQHQPDLVDTSYLRGVAERWRPAGLDLEWDVVHDPHAGRGLADWLNDDPTTLTVAATHGRSGLERATLGGISNQLLRHLSGPMVLRIGR
jgi:nucleotide-binding universal stress UspA family protein